MRTAGDAPKYDPYTGEPTKSDKGRPQQVKPSSFSPGDMPIMTPSRPGMGVVTSITSNATKPVSFGDRVRRFKDNNTINALPDWKGQSGRLNNTKPDSELANKMEKKAPLSNPVKNIKRAMSPIPDVSGQTTPVSFKSSDDPGSSRISHAPESSHPTLNPAATSRPERKTPSPQIASPQMLSPKVASAQFTSPDTLSSNSRPLVSSPPYPSPALSSPALSDSHKSNQYSAPFAYAPPRGPPTPTEDPSDKKPSSIMSNLPQTTKGNEQVSQDTLNDAKGTNKPGSWFDLRAYNPYRSDSSPRPSGEVSSTQQPIANRRRPVESLVGNNKATVRKAIPQKSPVLVSKSDSISSRNSKSLPKSPPETESVDLVTSLQARLEDLANRKQNVQRGIHQMTELMPADVGINRNSVVLKRREEEKRKVEILRNEEADIRREEHELGLKLHRAWKRMDQQAIYEPTSLWVRRVAS
jgi:hypothetical protein